MIGVYSFFLLIGRFNEIFGGVLLAYDIQIVGKDAPLLQDIHPFVRIGLTGKLLVFSPKTNMLLGRKFFLNAQIDY